MTRTAITYLLTWIIAAALSGCNSDIFVKDIPDIESQVTVEGNNGSKTIKIQKKGLKYISLDNASDFYTYTTCYNKNGEIISDQSTIDRIAKIVYSSPRFTFEAGIEGDNLKLTSLDNTYKDDLSIFLNLDYGYTSKLVTVTVKPGSPLLTEIGYDMNTAESFTENRSITPMRITNNGDKPVSMIIYPYKEAKSSALLKCDEYWTNSVSGIFDIPVYTGGKWDIDITEKESMTIGYTHFYTSKYVDESEELRVEIPANSTTTVIMTFKYAKLNIRYIATLTQPNSELTTMISGECEVSQPVSYTYEIK